MKIISDLNEFDKTKRSAVAIGKFDGIHVGHKELLSNILEKKKEGLLSVVFTFDTSAASFFAGKEIKEVTTISEKRLIFEYIGVDVLVEFPLTEESARISPEDFIKDVLVQKLNMSYIAAGDDISYGYKGMGDADLLKKFADEYGYQVNIINKVMYGTDPISSTMVRDEISMGHMGTVTELLGHHYSFTGSVGTGKQLGRTLGMPTLNLYPDAEKILPPFGVYYSNVISDGNVYHGITNIGVRPTVSEGERISVETYLYDFNKDMYGKKIATELISFKRPEMKFKDVTELKERMQQDIREGREFFHI